MPTTILSTQVQGAVSNTYTFTPDDTMVEGDLMCAILCVGNVAVEAASLTLDTDWQYVGSSTSGVQRVLFAIKYATANEPASYNFVYTASRVSTAYFVTMRGAQRDYNYNPALFPLGYFAPAGSIGAAVTGTATSLPSVTGSSPETEVPYTRVLYLFMQHSNTSTPPYFDDVSPLQEILGKLSQVDGSTAITTMLVDAEYEALVDPPATLTVRSSQNRPYLVFSFAVEPFDTTIASVDTYKSKLLRSTMPEPYDTDLDGPLGKLLAIIGTSDNDIGGLFGDADFLPNIDEV